MRYVKNKFGTVHSVTDEHYDTLMGAKGSEYTDPDDDEIAAFHEATGGESGDPKPKRTRKAKADNTGTGDGGSGDGGSGDGGAGS